MNPDSKQTTYIYCEAGVVEVEYLNGELSNFHFVQGIDDKLMAKWYRGLWKMTDKNIHMPELNNISSYDL
jgi:hypothetical protein